MNDNKVDLIVSLLTYLLGLGLGLVILVMFAVALWMLRLIETWPKKKASHRANKLT